jgi:uncharacterized membrane protein
MNIYLIVKWLHILSSTFLFGTGIGSAYYMLFTSLTRDPRAVASVVRLVVLADWIFTTTTIVIQPVTGVWMAHLAGLPLATPWIFWSIVLYFVAGACWLPVVWMQIRMRRMAQEAVRAAAPLPARYFQYLKVWTALGIPAFFALVVVFWLMVAKPT